MSGLPCKLPPGTCLMGGKVEASGDDWVLIRGMHGKGPWPAFIEVLDWLGFRRAAGWDFRTLPVGSSIPGFFRREPGGSVLVEAVGFDWIVVRGDEVEYYEIEDWAQFIAAVKRGGPVPPPFPGLRGRDA